jgi:hypothetical protein
MISDFRGHVRALLYVVQFERDPADGVARAIEQVVRRRALDAGPEEYLASVRAALASDEELAALIPQPHPEDAVRRFLGLVEQRLAAQARVN